MKKIFLVFLLFMTACTHVYTHKGMYYRVSEGDTLSKISSKYKVSAQELAEINNIESSQQLKPGRSIYIPGMTPRGLANIIEKTRKTQGVKSSKSTKPSKAKKSGSKNKGQKETTDENIVIERDRFSWPIQGEVSSPFGIRRGRRHDGIDIRSPIGTPIAAAAAGEVVYAKRMRGYGNLVLLRHEDDFFTVYAHNTVNLVKMGQKVKKGQIIAKVGRTGRATGPHLHFEVRQNTKARNPLFFLPKNDYVKNINFEDDTSANAKDGDSEEMADEHADEDSTTENMKAPPASPSQSTAKPPIIVKGKAGHKKDKKIIIKKVQKKVVLKKKMTRARPEKKAVKAVKKEKKNGKPKK